MFHVSGRGKALIVLITVAVAIIPLIMINAQTVPIRQTSEKSLPGLAAEITAQNFESYRDSQSALRQGINGYIDLSLTETTLRQFNVTGYSEMNATEKFSIQYQVLRGDIYNFTLQLKFTSHNPQVVTEAHITFDPHAEFSDKSGTYSKDHKLILLNDLIDYYPQNLVIRDGETRNVTMVITIPGDLPSIKLKLYLIGVQTDFPIVNSLGGFIYVKER